MGGGEEDESAPAPLVIPLVGRQLDLRRRLVLTAAGNIGLTTREWQVLSYLAARQPLDPGGELNALTTWSGDLALA